MGVLQTADGLRIVWFWFGHGTGFGWVMWSGYSWVIVVGLVLASWTLGLLGCLRSAKWSGYSWGLGFAW